MEYQTTKQDLRVIKTHKYLFEALFSLMKEKPFDAITVTDICKKAMIHRTTFYHHFEDKYHLLRCALTTLQQKFLADIPPVSSETEPSAFYALVAGFRSLIIFLKIRICTVLFFKATVMRIAFSRSSNLIYLRNCYTASPFFKKMGSVIRVVSLVRYCPAFIPVGFFHWSPGGSLPNRKFPVNNSNLIVGSSSPLSFCLNNLQVSGKSSA